MIWKTIPCSVVYIWSETFFVYNISTSIIEATIIEYALFLYKHGVYLYKHDVYLYKHGVFLYKHRVFKVSFNFFDNHTVPTLTLSTKLHSLVKALALLLSIHI